MATTLAPVVQTLDSTIYPIKVYPMNNAIGFPNTYLLDSNLSGGQRYPAFEQPGPGQNVLGHLRKLGTKTNFANLTHILPLKKATGYCYKGLFLLSPSPPSSVDCVELKLECTDQHCTGGKRGGKMPQFDELL